jgi:hypothetical protein
MSEQHENSTPEIESRKLDILRITPAGQDPLIYWHQVAQDAIRSAEKERERAKAAVAGRDKAERDLKDFTDHVISMATNRVAAVPLDLTRLIEKVELGDIDLNLSLYISRARE